VFNNAEIKSFLDLADDHHEEHEGEGKTSGRKGTLAERVLAVLDELEAKIISSVDNLR